MLKTRPGSSLVQNALSSKTRLSAIYIREHGQLNRMPLANAADIYATVAHMGTARSAHSSFASLTATATRLLETYPCRRCYQLPGSTPLSNRYP